MGEHAPAWSLATIQGVAGTIACIEVQGKLYRLEPSLARAGLSRMASVIDLFSDWDRSLAALGSAAMQVVAEDLVPTGTRLAPLLYPGKILCAGANYFDHLAEMGMPGGEEGRPAAVLLHEAAAQRRRRRRRDRPHADRHRRRSTGRSSSPPSSARRLAMCRWRPRWTMSPATRSRSTSRPAITTARRRPSTSSTGSPGKANDTCCPLGPRLVPAAAIADPQDIGLKLSVNGAVKQDGRSTDMIFSVAEQIAHRLAHHDARSGRRAADRHAGRRRRAEEHVPAGRRPRRCRDRWHRHLVRRHPATGMSMLGKPPRIIGESSHDHATFGDDGCRWHCRLAARARQRAGTDADPHLDRRAAWRLPRQGAGAAQGGGRARIGRAQRQRASRLDACSSRAPRCRRCSAAISK